MCGINGILGLGTLVDKENIILRMNQAMIHRGPDAGDTYHDDHISLGHRRLSIIGLDETGNQPMKSSNEDVVLVFNGEIYNYKELKLLTPTYPYKSHTDTEVIIALYQSFGFEKMLELIDGMFAIALWDIRKKKLYIARDRFGKKPLYYSIVEDGTGRKQLVFSSEIRGLLASKLFIPKLNKEVLGEYLQIQCVREPNTLLYNSFQLRSGHWMSFDSELLSNENIITAGQICYWTLKSNSNFEGISKQDAEKKFKELLYKSVEKRLMSDVPVGAFLSGGLDSSAVVIAMSEIMTTPINTVCIDSNVKGFNESRFADLIAKRFGTNHRNVVLSDSDFYSEFESALEAMDHPSTDIFNSYIVCKYMKNTGVTVALNGTGGDELLGGYSHFDLTYKFNKFWRLKPISSFVNSFTRMHIGDLLRRLKFGQYSKFIDYPYSNFTDFHLRMRSLVYGGQMVENIKSTNKFSDYIYSTLTDMELEYYLKPMLLKDIDNMSMAHSLEVRTPFLDPELAQFCYSIPDKYKQTAQPKKFLIDALKTELPLEIQNRKKQGFTFPKSHWESRELKRLVLRGLLYSSRVKDLKDLSEQLLNDQIKWSARDSVISRLLAVLGHWIKNNNIEIE